MRISDWSSDVCSSDLLGAAEFLAGLELACRQASGQQDGGGKAGAGQPGAGWKGQWQAPSTILPSFPACPPAGARARNRPGLLPGWPTGAWTGVVAGKGVSVRV